MTQMELNPFFKSICTHLDHNFAGNERQAKLAEFDRFVGISKIPSLKDEHWKYTSLRALNELVEPSGAQIIDVQAIAAKQLVADQWNIVLIDGRIAMQSLLPSTIEIKVAPVSLKKSKIQDGFFPSVSALCAQEQLSIRFLKDTEKALYITSVSTGLQPISSTQIHIEIVPGVKGTIVEKSVSLSSELGCAVFPSTHLEVLEGGIAQYVRVQNGSSKCIHISQTKAEVSQGAQLIDFQFDAGGQLTRHDLHVELNGEGATCRMGGLALLHGNQHVDNHSWCAHKHPNGTSNQIYKSILADSSRSVFNGTILVSPGAVQTEAFQLNKNLMLSNDCEVDTKPQLEIECDDVKCTHGASIGALNADELFYLESRGIRPETAFAMLCEAFAADSCDQIQHAHVQVELKKMIQDHFGVKS